MCKKAVSIITPALESITEADALLRIKNVLALFIQTMDVSLDGPSFLDLFGKNLTSLVS